MNQLLVEKREGLRSQPLDTLKLSSRRGEDERAEQPGKLQLGRQERNALSQKTRRKCFKEGLIGKLGGLGIG